jgi:hypothetical protein
MSSFSPWGNEAAHWFNASAMASSTKVTTNSWLLSRRRLFYRIGRRGSRLQDGHRRPVQTIGHILIPARRGKRAGFTLHPQQPTLGPILETPAQSTRQTQ